MIRNSLSADERLATLSTDKAKLLQLLLERESAETQKIEPCPRGDGVTPDRFAASGSQQRLWFIDQLEGGSAAYNVHEVIRLVGELDKLALQAALDTLVQRHESLRTVFIKVDGQPVQEITRSARFALRIADLTPLGAPEREAEVLRQSREEMAEPFDLSVGPLARGRLLELSQDESVLLLTMHHIVSDGWSMGILTRELVMLYEAFSQDRAKPITALPIQYADYAQWQRQWLRRKGSEGQLAYWKESLTSAPELLELPTDRPRPAVQSYRGAAVRISIGEEVTAQLRALAQKFNLTMAMTLYTAWLVVLCRLSGQSDLVVGMPVANRRRMEFEGIIGFFVNTLAVRVRLDDDPRIADLLQRVKDVMLAAYENQDAPFDEVVKAIQPARSLSHSPIFQVLFVLQNAPRDAVSLPGLKIVKQEVLPCTSHFDVSLSLEESERDISGTLNYATDLFDGETIERWAGCFEAVLRGMAREPQLQVSRLPLMTEIERNRVMALFNATRVEYPREKLVHELFEEQVLRTPQAVAVEYEGESLTYAELNAKANQLARYLRDKGIGADRLAGVCVERSLEMVVSLLGILKAGGAYVPLDPSYPAERLAYMLADAAPGVLLTQERLKGRLPPTRTQVIALDGAWSEIAQGASSNLDPTAVSVRADHLAYVIYTSGSTGNPKGAMNEHRGVVNRLQWMQDQYRLGGEDRVLQKTPFSFDVSVWEFFWTLMSGARLIVARPDGHKDPSYLRELIEKTGVTTLHFVPSMLQSFLEQHRSGECSSVRHVVCSGEELPAALQRRCLECLPQAALSNLYGPTEAAVDVTAWECRLEDSGGRVPIGRPISNIQMYVLDRHDQPVPIGVAGEVYIGGVGVGRGYLNRPELTRERFVPDPFSADAQARMYKTGDLGRWRADGAIEYLGRNDHQVKIRGFRIELGEIEARLTQQAQVKEAVVIAREDVAGEKRLVAYYTLRGESAPSVEELRGQLKAVLPEYMVPSAFVVLERLPLSPNGKLDRRALPAPELGAFASRQYEAPQGEIEEILAGIWQGLLRVERVGRRDNFFELGGHSLLIVQMKERLRRVGLSTEVRRVFESPTLADLASALTSETVAQFEVPANLIPEGCEGITPQMLPLVELDEEQIRRIEQAVPGGAGNIQDIYPLAPLQEGILFHHLLDERRGDTYVLPTVLSVTSRERLEELIAALQEVIDRHDVLRTAVLWEQLSRPVQVVYRQATLPVEELALDRGSDPLQQVQQWIQPERQRLDLRQAPLMRLQIAADPRSQGPHSGGWYVLLQLHHITCDHITMEVVIAEVVAHLERHAQQLPTSVPYRNHVAQALAYARRHDAEAFFRGKLQEVDEPTAPFGLLDVHGDGTQIEEAQERFGSELAQRVRSQARRLAVSAATLFHAAWGLVVARTSGRDEVVFGTVLLGRMQGSAGAQRTLGMFINTLPLRLRLSGTTARELVEQTQRELVELLSHEQASLAVAQRCSGIVGSAPLFTSMLNYRHSVPNSESEWGGASGIKVITGQERTNYPLSLAVDDLGEGFTLTAQTDRRIDPHRLTGYLHAAVQSLVEALEQAPQTPALALSILPLSERQQIIDSFNATRVEYPREKLVHELFEEQVLRTPQAVAVEYEGESLTYAELNAKANQLARYLRDKGIGADRLAGVCVERSLEMVVSLLGILKAGGAYVPLDPSYPAERLAYMLADAAPGVLLTQERLKGRLPPTRTQVIALDGAWSEIAQGASSNLDPTAVSVRADHLAYVIYTSGSTGNPKGAMNEHRGVVNRLQWMQDQYRLGGEDRVLQKTPFSFDVSVWEFFWTLMSGARLIVARPDGHKDPSYLRELIEKTGVTTLHFVPSMLQSFLEQHRSGECSSVRHVVCSGEELPAALQRRCLECLPQAALSNLYGPTEAAVDVTAWECRLEDSGGRVPIGRPISNIQMYVLDRHDQPVPIGVAGEVYIGGVGVGRGYLNRPELTRERFVPDPFSADAQARMYKTGDLGRWRADGAIEYLGRNDHQVKIRGFRIELGEIEARLTQQAQVKEAVVIAREDVAGEKRLVAYYTLRGESAPSVEELRGQLKAVLPEYMVPSAFVVLERLPLSPNGKLDRRALPAPELGAFASRQYEAPQGEIEEILAGIWQGLLRVERVGRRDNFFELGGHSLLIVQMKERLRRVGLSTEVRRVFESPTLADLASALTSETVAQFEVPANLIPEGCEGITPQMLPLVELDEEQIRRIEQAVPGGAGNIQDIYPLAPLQEGILFHHLLDERRGDTYVLPTVLSVTSRERLEELIAALQEVIDRHDVLRTAVLWEQLSRPVQVVYRQATLPVEELALDRGSDPLQQVQQWIQPERQRLDLRQAPLMRLQIAADPRSQGPHSGGWYVLLQLHHITCDHITMEVVIAEVVAHLERHAQQLPTSVPYRNHVAQALAYARRHDAEAFFRGKLQEVDEPTAPFGLLDVHGDGTQIEEAQERFGSELAQRVRSQARRLAVSAATLFHAAWGLVVARTSGRDEVVFGTVLLGRMQGSAGAQRTLGMFINTLPLRLRLSGTTARELVEQTQRELVELLSHEQASLAVAQRCSGIVGSAPLFTSMLNYRHSVPNSESEWGGASGIKVITGQERTNYPLSLAVDDLGEGFTLTAQTDRRIDPHRLTGYLHAAVQSLVEALEQAPQTPALALSILPLSERQQIIDSFNATRVEYPREKLVHELFEEQVLRTPQAVAVEYEGESLTYAELNAKANQLARYLVGHGVGPDQVVGICVERGLDMVVGVFGILKAGGAYLPLDPSYPAERLAYMLADAAPHVVLAQPRSRGVLPKILPAVLSLGGESTEVDNYDSHNLERRIGGEGSAQLAYVIYTSGSTGKPKGVMVSHRNLMSSNEARRSFYGDPGRFLLLSPIGFDSSVAGIFGTLIHGGTLLIASQEVARDPALLMMTIQKLKVTSLLCIPGLYQRLLALPEAVIRGSTLSSVVVAGETCPAALISESAQCAPEVLVFNEYGPTEGTVWASVFPCRDPDPGASVPIGYPIANARIYILNNNNEPVPIGVSGEIYIGGHGVARGYLNRPELTRERFVPDPFSADAQARMYKTGDLGRWRADGAIEYLGRNDHQVKIRGFRIELGEIEARLTQQAQVKEAVVIAREDVAGEKRLVAYYTLRGESAPSVEELRGQLKAVLPEYMVPSAFVVLERLPLSPNGKLDRRALPAPELGAFASRQYEAPQGEIEEILAGIWQGLLRVERVGRRDNFFELGGHSLLIVQMKERLRRVGLSTEVRRVFESPTLADLASALTSETVAQFEVPANLIPEGCEGITPQMLPLVELDEEQIRRIEQAVPGGAGNIQDIYPLAPLQEGILFHHLLDERRGDTYVLPTVLSVTSRERLEELIAALQEVIDRHDVLRTAVLWEQLSRPVQVVYRQATLPVEELALDRGSDPLQQVQQWIQPERQRLDLRQAPLMRLQIAADPRSGAWYVLLLLHHITGDTSLRDVISEVVAHLEKRAQQLPVLVPYRNHVAQALAYARRHDAEAFFRGKLQEVDEPTAPFGLLDVHGDGTQIEEAQERFGSELAQRVRSQARRLAVSAATLFHAAWGLVVARTSGRDEVVFGTVLLGRMQGSAGAQRTLGMFINTLPLRLRLSGTTARELVEQTQRELVELLSHEQASLAVAQRCSRIADSAAPLFTALLNYRHGAPNADAGWSNASGIQVLVSRNRTNYPITLSVDDLGEGFTLTAQTDRRLDPHRLTGYLHTAVQSLVEALERAPQTPALGLSILPPSELREVVESFNATSFAHSRERLVHELFEEQVQRTPDVVAVTHEGQSLTYAELNARANQLARYLVSQGVGPDQPVGICVERNVKMVMCLLSILKAGGAYVPLDPNYPADRLKHMLEDSAPRVVLTEEGLQAILPESPATVIALDRLLIQLEGHVADNLSPSELKLRAQHLVYVIYTSGSTGRPKGTAMPHRSMVNLIEWHRKNLSCSPGRRVLQFAAISFDVAFQEILSTLCTGGTLVLLDEWVRRDARALMELLERRSIQRLFVPPLMLQSLAECSTSTHATPGNLRDVIAAGEQLRITPEISGWFKKLSGCRLHNHYGPTETHVVTALTLDGSPDEWPALPGIGRPISNTQIYVLDERRQPVPVGVVGEIYIGGAGLARGYLKRAQLTSERFISDPFSLEFGALLYRTGDLGRWQPDGTLECLGRNDGQVKIRGFRIELGEIEAQLARHEKVRTAVVVTREDVPGEKRLVAYVIPCDQRVPLTVDELRTYLKGVLAEHMIPSAFVVMERLPLSPNGKLDRRALPAPELGAYASRQYEAPQGEIEETLAAIWQEMLRVERVGRHDNFFELGGHSLHGMKLSTKVDAKFAIHLSVIAVFQYPTIQQMAQIIEAGLAGTRALTEDETDFEEGVIGEAYQRPLGDGMDARIGVAYGPMDRR